MNIINLFEYVKHWQILRNLEDNCPFDLIIYENIDSEVLETVDTDKINIKTFSDFNFDFWVSWILKWAICEYKKVLIVIDSLPFYYMIPFFQNNQSDVTILNLWTWVSSYANKTEINLNDIDVLSNYNVWVYEAYDFMSMFNIIKKDWIKYIRIANKDLPSNLFQWSDEIIDTNANLISFENFEISWENWTILCWWYLINYIIGALDAANQNGKNFDLFGIVWYNIQLNQEIIDSLNKTEKLILIVDWDISNNLNNSIKAQLANNWLNDIEIELIIPDFNNIKSNQAEYVFEEAWFDMEWLYNKLMEI